MATTEQAAAGSPVSAGSAEMLRRLLQLMSKHRADFSPESYTLWYAYVDGSNLRLVQELDVLVCTGARLSPLQTTLLYETSIGPKQEDALINAQEAFSQLLQRTAKSTSTASESTTEFLEDLARET